VFTPTFNRAYTLLGCYESLCAQTCGDFGWVVVDDGSTDGTKELVMTWQRERKLKIQYLYQENYGKHVAFNLGASVADGELFLCLDSDDILRRDAIENITSFWNEYGTRNSAGVVACKAYTDGTLVGTPLPQGISMSTVYELYHLFGVQGDKAMIFRTDLLKHTKFPKVEGEKFITEAYLYDLIDSDYRWLLFNEVLMQITYLPDGYTRCGRQLLVNNPRGFAMFYKNRIEISHNWFFRYLSAVRYVNCCLIARHKSLLKDTPSVSLTLMAFPTALLIFFTKYWRHTLRIPRRET